MDTTKHTADDLQGERDRLQALAAARLYALGRDDDATVVLRDAVHEAIAAGMPEVEAARLAGVTRTTARAWLGK